jgi:hypothetical protein
MKSGVKNGVNYKFRLGVRRGYKTDAEVLDYFNNPAVIAAFGDPEAKLVSYISFSTTNGGTQSQGAKLILSNGKEYFVKQTKEASHVQTQKRADQRIRLAMGAYIDEAPFPFMVYGDGEFGKNNGLIVFPAISGKTLISHATSSDAELAKINRNIGAALGKVHVACLLSQGKMEEFYEKGCGLHHYDILVHEDFQASNVMIANDGKVYFIDTDGMEVSKNAYQNLSELWEMCDDAAQMKGALEGYLSNYEPEHQQLVLNNIRNMVRYKGKDLPEEAFPTKLPVTPAPAMQEDKKKVASPKSVEPLKSTTYTQLKDSRKEVEKSIKVSKREGDDEEVKRQKMELERIKAEEDKAKAAAAFAHKQDQERKMLAESVKRDAHAIKGTIKKSLKELNELVAGYKQSPSDTIEQKCKSTIDTIESLKSQLDQKFLVLTSAGANDEKYVDKVSQHILAAGSIKQDLHIPKLEQSIITGLDAAKKGIASSKEGQRIQRIQEQEREQQAALARQQAEQERLKAEQDRLAKEKVRLEKEKAAQAEKEEADRQEQLRVAKEQEEARLAQEKERQAQQKALEEAARKEEQERKDAEERAKETAALQKVAEEKAEEAKRAADEKRAASEKAAEAKKAAETAKRAAEQEAEAAEKARAEQEQAEQQRLREEQARLAGEASRVKAEQAALAAQKASEERQKLEQERQAQAQLAIEQERDRAAQQRGLEALRLQHEQEAQKARDKELALKDNLEPTPVKSPAVQAIPKQTLKTSPAAFAELRDSSKRSVDAFLAGYGSEKSAIERMLKNHYQGKRTEKKLKGLMQNFGISKGVVFTNKRDKQISDLAAVMAKLQAETELNSHEKAIILQGALQSVIDNIQRSEKNNKFTSRLMTICHDMQAALYSRGVEDLDPNASKILFHSYNSEGGATTFRTAAEDMKKGDKLQRRL